MLDPNIIDLTGDSPVNRGIRQGRRRAGNTQIHSVLSRTYDDYLNRLGQNSLDDSVILVIPNDNTDPRLERRKIAKNTGEIITFDDTISDESNQTPCINDSTTGRLVPLICPICFEELSSDRKPTSTKCGHIFCAECLQRSIAVKKICPKCQKAITLRSHRRLYF